MTLGAVFGGSRRAVALSALAGAAVVAGAVFVLRDTTPEPDADLGTGPEVAAPATEAPDTGASTPVAEDAVAEAGAEAPVPPPTPVPPSFDQVRVAPDGSAVVAGRAPAGADVTLLADGQEVSVARAGGDGGFAAIFTLPPSDAPRIMSLSARLEDGVEVEGVSSVIIAPFGARDVADAVPDAVPEDGEPDGGTAAAADDGAPAATPAPVPQAAPVADAAPGRAPQEAEGDAAAEDLALAADDPAPPALAQPPAGADDAAEDIAPDRPEQATAGAEEVDGAASRADAAGEDAAGLDIAALPEGAAEETPEPVSGTSEASPEAVADVPSGAGAPTSPAGPDARPPEPEAQARIAGPTAPPGAEPGAMPSASRAPSVVIAGPDGLRVVQGSGSAPRGDSPGAPPSAQTEIRLDAIAYDLEGDVTLSGSGAAAGRVQVLIDGRPLDLGEIGPDGNWSLELPDVDPGTYTLTVAQLSSEGEVVSRVETPFLREDPARIAANPMLVEPGVSVITVQPGFTLWGIAEANFGDGFAYVQVFEENRDQIRDPDWIFPGQIFRLPEELPRTRPRP
jgi:nucleoid-associated protein YgaU